MPLPVAEALTTPCLTQHMPAAARNRLKERYRKAKKLGIKAAWGVVTGAGVFEIGKEVVKGAVVNKGKKKIGALIILGCSHVGLGALSLVTNSTKLLNYTKKAHSITSCIYRCAHDASEVPFVALDFLVFGEYVPSCSSNEYQWLNVTSDALSNFD